jgi:hypothetical protein
MRRLAPRLPSPLAVRAGTAPDDTPSTNHLDYDDA